MQVRHAATRAYILTHLIILILSMCVTSANVDFMQLLLQLEQEKGEKQQLDWLVSEGKKQVQCHTPYVCASLFPRSHGHVCRGAYTFTQVAAGAQSLMVMSKDRDTAIGQVQ